MDHQPSALDRAIEQQEQEVAEVRADMDQDAADYIKALEERVEVISLKEQTSRECAWLAMEIGGEEDSDEARAAKLRRNILINMNRVTPGGNELDTRRNNYLSTKRQLAVAKEVLQHLNQVKEGRRNDHV